MYPLATKSKAAGIASKTMQRKVQNGFSLLELLIAMGILLTVSAVVLTMMFQMSTTQASVANRTDMHSSIRSVTELLQQEISQGGRVAVPGGNTTLSANVAAGAATATVSSTSGLFIGELLLVSDNVRTAGNNAGCAGTGLECAAGTGEEVIRLTNIAGSTITPSSTFAYGHNNGAVVRPIGAFSTGIVPTAAAPASYTNGSSGTVLKVYGDINDTGNMVYVEYVCNPNAGGTGTLTRMELPALTGTAAQKADPANTQVLLSNLLPNPGGVACFTYQQKSILVSGVNYYFVVDVAVTLTGQTPFPNPHTHAWDPATRETKALLNVSPRNIFEIWQMASLPGYALNHIQPAPVSGLKAPSNVTTALLP